VFDAIQTLPLPAVIASFAVAGLVQTALVVGLAGRVTQAVGRRVTRTLNLRPRRPGQVRDERLGVAMTIGLDSAVLGVLTWSGWLPATDFVLGDALITFAAAFAWFELAFYVVHRSFHSRAAWRFHVRHHRSSVPTVWSSMNFDPVERLGMQVGYLAFPLVLGALLPFSRQGLAAYYLFNLALNALHHGNVEVVPRWVRRLPVVGLVIAPSAQHALHHARSRGNYGLFTSVPDRLFGTLLPETDRWYDRATEEQGETEVAGQRQGFQAMPYSSIT